MRCRGRLRRVLAASLAATMLAATAHAHEVRPAYLQIREIEPETYDLLWKTPAQGDVRLALDVALPPECADVSAPRGTLVDGAVVQRWRTHCAGGLLGRRIAVRNLNATLTDAIVRYEPAAGAPKTLRLTPERPDAAIPERQPWTDVASSYLKIGVEHILFGFDHLAFVLALVLLVNGTRALLAAVTAFTVAHSLTLAGTTLGVVRLSAAPVEALIALSIAFVAAEVVRAHTGRAGLTARMPWLASFAFGLLHGFGFASALRQVGLPEEALGVALLFFNLGVEAGQLIFIAAVLAAIGAWNRLRLPAPQWVRHVPAYAIGGVAAFWFLSRTVGILAFPGA